MTSLPTDNSQQSKAGLSIETTAPPALLANSADPLLPWSYCYPYDMTDTLTSTANNTGDSFDMLQSYDLNDWAQQSQQWQVMLDNWMPPENESLQQNQKTGLLDLPSVSLPPTPPNKSPNTSFDFGFMTPFPAREPTPPMTSYSAASSPPLMTSQTPVAALSSSSSASSLSSFSISPPSTYIYNNNIKYRRRASDHPPASRIQKPTRRRASCHPSVASVVSLTAHEPVSSYVNGIEHITFLYSHERMVKEYTVRADVTNVDLDTIPLVFKAQNTIYPRANVEKSKYDGNRWEYETTCNTLGWKLCWLNQKELCGRRGLIQRAVDSYRNRHTEMRSRRVTRQEKVANGTLRKRKSKKCILSPVV